MNQTVAKWKNSIKREMAALKKGNGRLVLELSMDLETNVAAKLAVFEQMLNVDNISKALDKLLVENVVPKLEAEWSRRASNFKDYLPTYYSESEERINTFTYRKTEQKRGRSADLLDDLNTKNAIQTGKQDRTAQYAGGLRTLFSSIKKIKHQGNIVGLGPYDDIMAHDIRDYSILKPTQTEWTSFFYTVEYGTGIAANVGGARWVNTEGDTKSDNPPGSWFYVQHQYGQKGFHFLWEERTRTPRALYIQEIQKMLPQQLSKYFQSFGLDVRIKGA